jgi:hypothetical protein
VLACPHYLLCHRRQRADHHSHHGLTITGAAAQPNRLLTCVTTCPPVPRAAADHAGYHEVTMRTAERHGGLGC